MGMSWFLYTNVGQSHRMTHTNLLGVADASVSPLQVLRRMRQIRATTYDTLFKIDFSPIDLISFAHSSPCPKCLDIVTGSWERLG